MENLQQRKSKQQHGEPQAIPLNSVGQSHAADAPSSVGDYAAGLASSEGALSGLDAALVQFRLAVMDRAGSGTERATNGSEALIQFNGPAEEDAAEKGRKSASGPKGLEKKRPAELVTPAEIAELTKLSPELGQLAHQLRTIERHPFWFKSDAEMSHEERQLQAKLSPVKAKLQAQIFDILQSITKMPFFTKVMVRAKMEACGRIATPAVTDAIQHAVLFYVRKSGSKQWRGARITKRKVNLSIARAMGIINRKTRVENDQDEVDPDLLVGGEYDNWRKNQTILVSNPGLYFQSVDFRKTSVDAIVDGFIETIADLLVHEALAHAVPHLLLGGKLGGEPDAMHTILKLALMRLQGKTLSLKKLPENTITGQLNGTVSRSCRHDRTKCTFPKPDKSWPPSNAQ